MQMFVQTSFSDWTRDTSGFTASSCLTPSPLIVRIRNLSKLVQGKIGVAIQPEAVWKREAAT